MSDQGLYYVDDDGNRVYIGDPLAMRREIAQLTAERDQALKEAAALREALDKAAYALFQVKRMGVSDEVHAFVVEAHSEACRVLNKEGGGK